MSKIPADFFNKVFLKKEVAEDPTSAEDQLFDQLLKAASAFDDPEEEVYPELDGDLVKMAQLAVFFDVLNFVYGEQR